MDKDPIEMGRQLQDRLLEAKLNAYSAYNIRLAIENLIDAKIDEAFTRLHDTLVALK